MNHLKAAVIMFVLAFGLWTPVYSSDSEDLITVSGRGVIEAEPDIVDLHFELLAVAKTLADAKQQVDVSYTNVLNAIKAFNIANKDIKLTQLNAGPEYEWLERRRVLKGQRVSRNLQITIRDLDRYPEILQSLVDNGVAQISHVSTRFSDRSAIERKALAKAADVAKAKASFLAIEFDREVGTVVSIAESHVRVPLPFQRSAPKAIMAEQSIAGDAPPAQFGTQSIQADITVTYRLR